MSSESIALGTVTDSARPISEKLHGWITTVDHKRLGILYILFSPEVFNRMFTMHGTTMIFFVAMPILFGFGTYLIPLMVGARDMAFPRLNAFSFWMTAFGGLLLYFSFVGG